MQLCLMNVTCRELSITRAKPNFESLILIDHLGGKKKVLHQITPKTGLYAAILFTIDPHKWHKILLFYCLTIKSIRNI